MDNTEILAAKMYSTYCAAVGGVAFNGDPLPGWDEFRADPSKTKQSEAWRVVAQRSQDQRSEEPLFVLLELQERTNLPIGDPDFGLAIQALKAGKRVAREGWNGKGMFVYLVPANSYPAQTGVAKAHYGENALVPYNAYMALKGADDTVSTWVPSSTDTLAEDWTILP